MKSVDYSFWAGYIKEIHNSLGSRSDIALELGCGIGKLSDNLKGVFNELYLTDISFEMLKLNRSKYPKICCDMEKLPFKIKFDFIFSTFDSINYIISEKKMLNFFKGIASRLSAKGYFTFDASLKHNSIKHLKELNRKGKFKRLEYIQISDFNEETLYHTNKIKIKTAEGLVYKETHIQKIYDFYYYFDVLEKSGLYVAECFNAFDFTDGTPESDRIQFIVKRKV
jgi:ubiquinone/menaquinone biosynthesis C-methylase UbiE